MTRRPDRIGEADEHDARAAVVATALAMSRSGLSPGRSGNVSCRFGGGMLITPTGMAYEMTTPDDIVAVAADGSGAAGQRTPSSEWRFHLAAYAARPDRHAIVHTHSMHATVLACAHKPIPAFHYMVAVAGGDDIPLVPYATFGTDKLAEHVALGLAERDACLMANHGQIAMGRTLEAALELAGEIEQLAEQYCKVLLLGAPHVLDAAAMRDVIERFASYGQQVTSGAGSGGTASARLRKKRASKPSPTDP
ncbi:MAG: class II aldolase/adducin family protein [Hyphomicrobiaceae bacterium]|nr:class II aldolase/adducin family protein [Hyphomicrobiaceae bacterium]